MIPGLTRSHFTRKSQISDAPYYDNDDGKISLTKAKIYMDGSSFYFCWNVTSSEGYHNKKNKTFYLQATGNIQETEATSSSIQPPKWWGFECRCSCPEFCKISEKRTIQSNYMVNHVCQHLDEALKGCIEVSEFEMLTTNENSSSSVNLPKNKEKGLKLDDPMVGRYIALPDSRKDLKTFKIPGLTNHHFIYETLPRSHNYVIDEPYCVIAQNVEIDNERGNFDVQWRAKDSYLRVSGNIKELEKDYHSAPHWWGFTVECSCSDFVRQRRYSRASKWTKNYVCSHLASALTEAIDEQEDYDVTTDDYKFDDNSSVNATFQ
jgi:hypothetical protein